MFHRHGSTNCRGELAEIPIFNMSWNRISTNSSRPRQIVKDEAVGWASRHIEKLLQGETVAFRPRGSSMKGKIESGQLCTVEPIKDASTLLVDDIVLCKVHGAEYLHLIKAIQEGRFLIGNNRGRINGWIGSHSIFGRCVRVEP